MVDDLLRALAALAIFVLLSGCKKSEDVLAKEMERNYPCPAATYEETSKPTVLIIGDSISLGYTPFVQVDLADFQVEHSPCNALNSAVAVDRMDAWLDGRRWTAIVFNVGLWDVMKSTSVDPNAYKHNLGVIADKLRAATTHPVFALTTEVPEHAAGRRDSDVVLYNSIASRVMARRGIQVIDLYGASRRLKDHYVGAAEGINPHFDNAGYEALAREVSAFLLSEIAWPAKPPAPGSSFKAAAERSTE